MSLTIGEVSSELVDQLGIETEYVTPELVRVTATYRTDPLTASSFQVVQDKSAAQKVVKTVEDAVAEARKVFEASTPQEALSAFFDALGNILGQGADLLFGSSPEATEILSIADVSWDGTEGDETRKLALRSTITGKIVCPREFYYLVVRTRHVAKIEIEDAEGWLDPVSKDPRSVSGLFFGEAFVADPRPKRRWDPVLVSPTISSLGAGLVPLLRNLGINPFSGLGPVLDVLEKLLGSDDRRFQVHKVVVQLSVDPVVTDRWEREVEDGLIKALRGSNRELEGLLGFAVDPPLLRGERGALASLATPLLVVAGTQEALSVRTGFDDDMLSRPVDVVSGIGDALAAELSSRLGVVTLGDLLELGEDPGGAFSADALQDRLIEADLELGGRSLGKGSITRIVDRAVAIGRGSS